MSVKGYPSADDDIRCCASSTWTTNYCNCICHVCCFTAESYHSFAHHRYSLSIPSPMASGSGYSPASSPLRVYKWNVHFDGKTDSVTFIERLQEIFTAQGIQINRLLPHMPEILQGDASLWYRNNHTHWHTWTDFIQDFRSFIFPVNYAADLEMEISRRLQRPNEPASRYITELQTLIRRDGNMNQEQELQWLYRNLMPEYRQHVRKSDITDVISFSRTIREVELLLCELPASSTR
ncbi:hypothetical protein HUJ04_001457 [Dendroctonus ponderosae]|nr:hypothetical protein HUJ04_001457 [Dendroctonus ponderosae]